MLWHNLTVSSVQHCKSIYRSHNTSPIITCWLLSVPSMVMWWVFLGDRTLPAARCGNLSLEPVCRPSALQHLLVGSVCRPAVLRHHVCQRHCWPAGSSVLPAVKVWLCICHCVVDWWHACVTRYDCALFVTPPVSLNVAPRRTHCWAWPSWCPISLWDCWTYANST